MKKIIFVVLSVLLLVSCSKELSFLRTLEDDNWAFKRERPNIKITIIDNLYDRR